MILSLNASENCRSYVTAVIHHDDIVPRLCYGSMEDLKKARTCSPRNPSPPPLWSYVCNIQTLVNIIQQRHVGTLGRLWQALAAGKPLGAALTDKISSLLNVPAQPPIWDTLNHNIVRAITYKYLVALLQDMQPVM